jgi:hypothetical protein
MVLRGQPSFSSSAFLIFALLLGLDLANSSVGAWGLGNYGQSDTSAAGRLGSGANPAGQRKAAATKQATGFAGVLTWQNDNARDGQNLNETILTTSNVNQTHFGVKFTYSVDGQMYAQPLYVPNVTISGVKRNAVYVATENDSVYAFDADGSVTTPLWKKSFLSTGVTPVPSSESGCNSISPNMGITGTPVIDPATNTLYLVAATRQSRADSLKLHALDITTGKDKFGGPVTISASVSGVKFSASHHLQRPGLLLVNGTVYIGFGSHCDTPTYHGWLMAYNATTLKQTAVFLTSPKGSDGAIWTGGAGPSADSSGNIYVTTGNGTFDANNGGKDYGNSLLKFNSALALLDYFTPFNQDSLNSGDLDLGSTGVVLPPDQTGTHPHIMITAGKEGRIYVVDRDNLGHFQVGSDSQIVQSLPGALPAGTWTTAAHWNGNVYFAAFNEPVQQYTLTGGLLSSTPVNTGADTFGVPGATPSVSSNGTANGIVWLIDPQKSGAVLRAYAATNVSTKLYDSGVTVTSPGVKFAPPIVANGKVYVGTASQLVVFGLL